MIYSTVYVSNLVNPMAPAEIEELLEVSRVNNARQGITGLLVLRGRRVMQTLEGAEADVRSLFARIGEDVRHGSVVNVWAGFYDQRRYADWTMGFDALDGAPDLETASTNWPEPDWATITPDVDTGDSSVEGYVPRRTRALRRALVSGDRLVASLAIILLAHRPESVLDGDTNISTRCAECRSFTTSTSPQYPCLTAKNAIWALEATSR